MNKSFAKTDALTATYPTKPKSGANAHFFYRNIVKYPLRSDEKKAFERYEKTFQKDVQKHFKNLNHDRKNK